VSTIIANGPSPVATKRLPIRYQPGGAVEGGFALVRATKEGVVTVSDAYGQRAYRRPSAPETPRLPG
jgi:hypothetical protein